VASRARRARARAEGRTAETPIAASVHAAPQRTRAANRQAAAPAHRCAAAARGCPAPRRSVPMRRARPRDALVRAATSTCARKSALMVLKSDLHLCTYSCSAIVQASTPAPYSIKAMGQRRHALIPCKDLQPLSARRCLATRAPAPAPLLREQRAGPTAPSPTGLCTYTPPSCSLPQYQS